MIAYAIAVGLGLAFVAFVVLGLWAGSRVFGAYLDEDLPR